MLAYPRFNIYFRDNVAILQVMAKGQYYTSIKRDVSYTFSSLIGKIISTYTLNDKNIVFSLRSANIGGLLGLSMGCSIISIAELIILPLRQFVFTVSK